MANLRRLRVRNACQHPELDWKFDSGVTVLVGPNGSGKSNAMNLIIASLTNDFSFSGANKSDNIRRGSKGQSFVETYWSLNDGSGMMVRRVLSGNLKSTLEVNGALQLDRREPEISEACMAMLGVNAQALDEHVLIGQNRISALLTARPTERAKSMTNMLGLDSLLSIGESMRTESRYCDGVLSGSTTQDELARQKQELANLKAQLLSWKDRFTRCRKAMLPKDERKTIEDTLVAMTRRQELIKSRQTESTQVIRRKQEAQTAKQVKADATVTLGQLTAQLDQARAALPVVKEYERQKKFRDDIERLKRLLESPTLPEPTRPDIERCEELKLQLRDLSGQIAQVRKRKDELAAGKTVCSACGQPIVGAEKILKERESVAKQLDGLLATKEPLSAQWYALNSQVSDYQSALERYRADQSKRKQVQKELETLIEMVKDTPSPTATQTAMAQRVSEFERGVLDAKNRLSVAESAYNRSMVEYKTRHALLTKIRDELKQLPRLSRKKYDRLMHRLKTDQQWRRRARKVRVRVASLAGKISAAKKAVDDLNAQLKMNERLRKWSEAVSAARDLCQAKRLPSLVSSAVLSGIVDRVNSSLDSIRHLNLTFKVKVDDDLSFYATYPGGEQEPLSRLSCAQQACVSMLFWFWRLVTLDIGVRLLILDEPTANMDSQSVETVRGLLVEMNQLAKKNNLQVVVITHHQILETSANHVLRLHSPA